MSGPSENELNVTGVNFGIPMQESHHVSHGTGVLLDREPKFFHLIEVERDVAERDKYRPSLSEHAEVFCCGC